MDIERARFSIAPLECENCGEGMMYNMIDIEIASKMEVIPAASVIAVDVHGDKIDNAVIRVKPKTTLALPPQDTKEQLLIWKNSAMKVLSKWDRVFEALGSPGPLGASKAESALSEVEYRNRQEQKRRSTNKEANPVETSS